MGSDFSTGLAAATARRRPETCAPASADTTVAAMHSAIESRALIGHMLRSGRGLPHGVIHGADGFLPPAPSGALAFLRLPLRGKVREGDEGGTSRCPQPLPPGSAAR